MVGKHGIEIGCLLEEKFQKVNPYVLRETANCYLGKMNVYSSVSRWNRFELLIVTFPLQYCESSSSSPDED